MTPSGHRLDRNPAAQQSVEVCYPFAGKHGRDRAVNRRSFITLFGGAAAVWPLTARAQQAGKVPTIGFLGSSSASGWSPWTAAFVQRLEALGWVEGGTVAIEDRGAGERTEPEPEIAAKLVASRLTCTVPSGS